ncbi:hypothetical protein BJ742DRAFT_780784 [Cladochytrium replicatum]|nr:hypothetical protein BJ742DRAFT_780784 [Cladochytrium replicatum]
MVGFKIGGPKLLGLKKTKPTTSTPTQGASTTWPFAALPTEIKQCIYEYLPTQNLTFLAVLRIRPGRFHQLINARTRPEWNARFYSNLSVSLAYYFSTCVTTRDVAIEIDPMWVLYAAQNNMLDVLSGMLKHRVRGRSGNNPPWTLHGNSGEKLCVMWPSSYALLLMSAENFEMLFPPRYGFAAFELIHLDFGSESKGKPSMDVSTYLHAPITHTESESHDPPPFTSFPDARTLEANSTKIWFWNRLQLLPNMYDQLLHSPASDKYCRDSSGKLVTFPPLAILRSTIQKAMQNGDIDIHNSMLLLFLMSCAARVGRADVVKYLQTLGGPSLVPDVKYLSKDNRRAALPSAKYLHRYHSSNCKLGRNCPALGRLDWATHSKATLIFRRKAGLSEDFLLDMDD